MEVDVKIYSTLHQYSTVVLTFEEFQLMILRMCVLLIESKYKNNSSIVPEVYYFPSRDNTENLSIDIIICFNASTWASHTLNKCLFNQKWM